MDTVFGNERHITYSGDKFLKVETWKGEIEKVERYAFERTTNRGLWMRPYFTCNDISSHEELLNNRI